MGKVLTGPLIFTLHYTKNIAKITIVSNDLPKKKMIAMGTTSTAMGHLSLSHRHQNSFLCPTAWSIFAVMRHQSVVFLSEKIYQLNFQCGDLKLHVIVVHLQRTSPHQHQKLTELATPILLPRGTLFSWLHLKSPKLKDRCRVPDLSSLLLDRCLERIAQRTSEQNSIQSKAFDHR
eukprot:Phypoly_transcript_23420.p1 GENE.Phypoly_transcript_23420~~Phypoly_transcript_23420.p1  ORF type:complete len:176 (-),score=9.72 Phypoly_transcript_23420:52-579(-)